MAVTGVNGVSNNNTTGNGSTATTGTPTVDYNAFLKLLLAQLKTQDPTKPMESTEFMAQLASFSNVEQSIKMNSKLDSLLNAQALSQAESMIGRTVTAVDGSASGKVTAVRVTDEGALALLDSGAEVMLGTGVIVS